MQEYNYTQKHLMTYVYVIRQVRGCFEQFVTYHAFTVRGCYPLPQIPSWRATHYRFSATAYLLYSQLPTSTFGRSLLHRKPHDVREGEAWTNLAQFTGKWRAVVNMVQNWRVPNGNFVTIWAFIASQELCSTDLYIYGHTSGPREGSWWEVRQPFWHSVCFPEE